MQKEEELLNILREGLKEGPEFSPIVKYLILGNRFGPTNPELFTPKYKVQAVLSIIIKEEIVRTKFPPEIDFLHINIEDSTWADIKQHFEESYQFIEKHVKQRKTVYVHCKAGISRSSTIVIYYLMRKTNMPLKKIIQFVKKKRPCIFPNPKFLQQLIEAEQDLGIEQK